VKFSNIAVTSLYLPSKGNSFYIYIGVVKFLVVSLTELSRSLLRKRFLCFGRTTHFERDLCSRCEPVKW